MDINKELNFYEAIGNDVSFMGLGKTETLKLLARNLSVNSGLNYMRSKLRVIPKISDDFLEVKDISGSESVIYFKNKDDKFIYKANNPFLKITDGKFNSYIWCLMLQEYIFPDYKYFDFKYVESEKKIFMTQQMCLTAPTTFNRIKANMTSAGWEYTSDRSGFFAVIEGMGILLYDLNESNARVKGMDVEGFDPRFELIY